tara:strand:+ start:9869 stop:11194 length:1326 start_codon:yes stop_codon:yes gene_type:complete
MANRFPLVIDTSDSNKIKELPVGDSLDLTGSGIINAASIQTNGAITAQSLSVNGQTLSAVALSGNFADLDGVPTGFSGSYNDLINKPIIPNTTRDLTDVGDIAPSEGDILQFNNLSGQYEPTPLSATYDIGTATLGDIGGVLLVGDTTNKFLKYYSGAWRAASVTYAEVTNKPTTLAGYGITDGGGDVTGTSTTTFTNKSGNISQWTNDSNYLTSVPAQTFASLTGTPTTIAGYGITDVPASLLDLGITDGPPISVYGAVLTSNGYGTFTFKELPDIPASLLDLGITDGDATLPFPQVLTTNGFGTFTFRDLPETVGNFTLAASFIDTDDSSQITIVPSVRIQSDLEVDNSLTVNNDLIVNGNIVTKSAEAPEVFSETSIFLTATTRVEVTQSPFKLASFTDAERDELTAENGDMIYNATNNRPEMYVNGAWKIVDTSPIV